jgi:probable rRNA maturation factor
VKILITDRSGKRGLKGKVTLMTKAILNEMDLHDAEISLLLTTDLEIKELNSRYLSKERATDVLSFPMDDATLLGDVVISVERAREQANSRGLSDGEEIARLLVHGTLHLLGFEHVNGGRQAALMKKREAELMRVLKAGEHF